MAGRFVWIPRFGGALGGLPVDQVPGCDLRRTGRFRPLGSRTITQTASRARPVQVFSVDAFASRALTRRISTCRMPPTPPCARSSFLARRQNRMSDVPTCLAPMDIAGQTRATAARSAGRIGLRILGGPLAPFPAPERRPTTPLPRVRTLLSLPTLMFPKQGVAIGRFCACWPVAPSFVPAGSKWLAPKASTRRQRRC